MFEICLHTCRVVPSPNTLCARHAHVSGGIISRQKSQTRSLRAEGVQSYITSLNPWQSTTCYVLWRVIGQLVVSVPDNWCGLHIWENPVACCFLGTENAGATVGVASSNCNASSTLLQSFIILSWARAVMAAAGYHSKHHMYIYIYMHVCIYV